MTQQLIQAYRQAPWRAQLQWIGWSLLVAMVGMLIAALYLSITEQATIAGVQIQQSEAKRDVILIKISDLRTQLANQTSFAVMNERAREMGFKEANSEDTIYIAVPGYTGRQLAHLAPPIWQEEKNPSLVIPAYKQSLWEWLFSGTFRILRPMGD